MCLQLHIKTYNTLARSRNTEPAITTTDEIAFAAANPPMR